eukprot:9729976-Karenia_brevis.AAC.1
MALREAGVVTQLSDVTESQHQTANMMAFGEDGWEVPHRYMQSYIEQEGGSPFMFHPEDDRVIGWKPIDE